MLIKVVETGRLAVESANERVNAGVTAFGHIDKGCAAGLYILERMRVSRSSLLDRRAINENYVVGRLTNLSGVP